MSWLQIKYNLPIRHKVDKVFQGLMFPTDIAFVGNDDLLVTEKNEGTVRRIVNETFLPDPLINLNVSTIGERGFAWYRFDQEC